MENSTVVVKQTPKVYFSLAHVSRRSALIIKIPEDKRFKGGHIYLDLFRHDDIREKAYSSDKEANKAYLKDLSTYFSSHPIEFKLVRLKDEKGVEDGRGYWKASVPNPEKTHLLTQLPPMKIEFIPKNYKIP